MLVWPVAATNGAPGISCKNNNGDTTVDGGDTFDKTERSECGESWDMRVRLSINYIAVWVSPPPLTCVESIVLDFPVGLVKERLQLHVLCVETS